MLRTRFLMLHILTRAVFMVCSGANAQADNEAVLAQLRDSVNGLDRRFDSRALGATPPSSEGNTISLSWQLTLSKTGAPDLTATGVEHATYTDGAISRLEDVFDEGTAEGLGEWMAAHGDSLD